MITTAIEKIKEKLNRKIEFISKSPDHDFWLEVKDYLNLLEYDPFLSGIIAKLVVEIKEKNRELGEIEKQALFELDTAREEIKLLREQYSSQIDEVYIPKKLEEYDSYRSGRTKSTRKLIFVLEELLIQIINLLREAIENIDLSKYIVVDRLGNIERSNISSSANFYRKKEQSYELEGRTKASKAFEDLDLIRYSLNLDLDELKEKQKAQNLLDRLPKEFFYREIRKAITEGQRSDFFERPKFTQHLLRLHDYILDNLEFQLLWLSLVTRFKQRVEWYQREELVDFCNNENIKNKRETELTKKICNFLFDMGVFPISEAIFGNKKPDIIGFHPGESGVVEVKVFEKKNEPYLKQGLSQIYSYMNTLAQDNGYLILFALPNLFINIKDHLRKLDKTIYITVIDLNEKPTKGKINVWDVTNLDDLI